MPLWHPRIDTGEWFHNLATDWRILRECSPNVTAATRDIVHENTPAILSSPQKEVFWLSLANYQWLDGCLTARARDRALDIIDRGSDRIMWLTPPARRETDFNRLRRRLLSTPPPSKPFGTRTLEPTGARIGDIICIRSRTRPLAALHVIDLIRYERERVPLCAAYKWDGTAQITRAKLAPQPPYVSPDDETVLLPKVPRAGNPCSTFAIRGLVNRFKLPPGVTIVPQPKPLTYSPGHSGLRILECNSIVSEVGRFLRGANRK